MSYSKVRLGLSAALRNDALQLEPTMVHTPPRWTPTSRVVLLRYTGSFEWCRWRHLIAISDVVFSFDFFYCLASSFTD